MQHDPTNSLFALAADLVNNTSCHLFLTGKAGTGKTTFLKYIKERTKKNAVVVAPTGVAAINAAGVTMHSFFQLPFGPFVPASQNNYNSPGEINDKHSLFRNIRFNSNKRELLEELELLIIDEVSMVRCDVLDAVDTILRHFRHNYHQPFGGVQVLYIGDMFQLPPVIPPAEWNILNNYYESPFFFSSMAVREAPPLYIELKKIYRQNEQEFIDILNRVRNDEVNSADFNRLHLQYDPEFLPPADERYIILTTHNRKADGINQTELDKLPGKKYSYPALIEGEFYENAYPTDASLDLKIGAQVMFIKNDLGELRRYYNGKLGTVKKIDKDEITVTTPEGCDIKVEKETWKNIRYNYIKENDEIEEEELGSFSQYPIRLAWAITIHKSQGLTFEKAVIDAGSSFAPGQVYVALSRCTCLGGIVLHSKINRSSIATDKRILEFAAREVNDNDLEEVLKKEKQKFEAEELVKAFSLHRVISSLGDWNKNLMAAKKVPNQEAALLLNIQLRNFAIELSKVADKFSRQLHLLVAQNDNTVVEERCNKAVAYFGEELFRKIITPFEEHHKSLRYASKVKKYVRQLDDTKSTLFHQLEKLNSIAYQDIPFTKYIYKEATPEPIITGTIAESSKPSQHPKPPKLPKGATQVETLLLYRQGKTVEEIATLRNLATGTIGGHLAELVYKGDVSIDELMTADKREYILEEVNKGFESVTELKQRLGDDYTYPDIRAVISYKKLMEEV
jgi:DNA-binding CsgD family transcriptional regulator